MKVDRQLIFLAASSVVVLLMGSFAFFQDDPNQGWLTAAYKAVQLFSVSSGVLGEGKPTPLLLEISRWLALGTLLVLIYTTVQALIGHLRSKFSIAFAKKHHIVCGAGQRGDQIARELRRRDAGEVVVVEMNEHNPALGELRNLGVHVVIGNALDASVLQSAGAERARSLIAVTGSDEKNLAICTEVKKHLNPTCDLIAGLESWAWRTFFMDRMEAGIRLESFQCRAALGLMLRLVACEAARSSEMRSKGLRISIEASPANRNELVRAAILTLQIAGTNKPILEITHASPEDEAAFNERFPTAHLVADLRWHRATVGQTFAEGSDSAPDFAVFALESDIATLEAAERFWMRHDLADHRVIACLDGDGESTAYVDPAPSKRRSFKIINFLKLGLENSHALKFESDQDAKICHAIYAENERSKDTGGPMTSGRLHDVWLRLPERLKESNRLAAMQHEVARTAWRNRGDTPATAMLAHLACCEHFRWMAEKAMYGWRWSGSADKSSRDDEKLKHHLLVPYEVLPSKEKDKDFNAFLWALEITDDELEALALDEAARSKVLIARKIMHDCSLPIDTLLNRPGF
jgi:hypothetical protein